jgi:hypothetical protein
MRRFVADPCLVQPIEQVDAKLPLDSFSPLEDQIR